MVHTLPSRADDLLELLRDLLQGAVDVELRSPAERLLAEGTLIGLGPHFRVPVGGDAGLAEAVAT